MKSVGIDIGSLSIKVAEVESSGASYVLNDFLELPLSPDPGVDHRVEIVAHLRRVAAHYSGTGAKMVFSLPQERLAVRTLNFPSRGRHQILTSLPHELDEDVPFDEDDAIYDAKSVRVHGNTSELLAVACPKRNVEELLKIAHEAGIDPDIITVDSFAISNLFEAWLVPPREILGPKAIQDEAAIAQSTTTEDQISSVEPTSGTHVLIHVGHRRTLVVVFYRNTLLTTRTISHGGHDVAEALRRAYNLPYQEALKGVQEKGFVLTTHDGATRDQIDFSKIISDALTPLASGIKLTLLEIKSSYGATVSQVLLSGGLSRLMNIAPYLTRELEVPCNVFHLSEKVPQSFALEAASLDLHGLPAVGTAIEGLKRPRNPPINLRRMEFGKQSRSFKNLVERWRHAAGVGGAMIGLFWIHSCVQVSLSDRLNLAAKEKLVDTAKDSFALKGRAATESKIKAFIKDKDREIVSRKQIAELQNLNGALDIVLLLSEKLPAKHQVTVDIRRFLVENESLTIAGEATTRDHVSLIRSSLEGIAPDRKVTDMKPDFQPTSGKLAFAFKLAVERR